MLGEGSDRLGRGSHNGIVQHPAVSDRTFSWSRSIVMVLVPPVGYGRHGQVRRTSVSPSVRSSTLQAHVVCALRNRESRCKFWRNEQTSAGGTLLIGSQLGHVVVACGGSNTIALWRRSAIVERTTENAPTGVATTMDEWRVARLSNDSHAVASARWTRMRRLAMESGRSVRSFARRTEHVFAGITTVVDA